MLDGVWAAVPPLGCTCSAATLSSQSPGRAGERKGPDTSLKGTSSLPVWAAARSASQIPRLQASLRIPVRTLGWAAELACHSLAVVIIIARFSSVWVSSVAGLAVK